MPASDEDLPDDKRTDATRQEMAVQHRYTEYTWTATCIASTLGAGYAVMVATFVSPRPVSPGEMMVVFMTSLFVALPTLFVGSALIGWWIAKWLVERVRTNRLLIFAMAGALMGIVADVVIVILAHLVLELSWSSLPRGATEWLQVVMIGTVPIFCLTVAGLISGLQATMSEKEKEEEQDAAESHPPPRAGD